MRLPFAFMPGLVWILLLAGCERQGAEAPQGDAPIAEAAGNETGTGRLDRSNAGKAAPEVEFEDPAGEPAFLSDFRGRPLLVNLWATWCAPCIEEMPTLDALAEREQDRLQVLAISQDLEGQDKVDAFFRERQFAMLEPYIDPDMELMTALQIEALPTTILYDAQGREVWRMKGIEDWTGERARALIAEAGVAVH